MFLSALHQLHELNVSIDLIQEIWDAGSEHASVHRPAMTIFYVTYRMGPRSSRSRQLSDFHRYSFSVPRTLAQAYEELGQHLLAIESYIISLLLSRRSLK